MTVPILVIVVYCMLLNIVSFATYALDKYLAQKHRWRVSEATLLMLAFLGGALGAILAIYSCRHKTRHLRFVILVPLFLVLHLCLLFLLLTQW